VLAIVTLIAQLVMEEPDQLSEDEIVGELLAVGFATEEIDAAFRWMEGIALAGGKEQENTLTLPTNRVYSAEEARAMSVEARGYLLRLRSMGVFDTGLHEEIVSRALQAEDEVSLRELKTIIALTLFSHAQNDWRREMECLFEDDWSRLYH
jgi:Smg protein